MARGTGVEIVLKYHLPIDHQNPWDGRAGDYNSPIPSMALELWDTRVKTESTKKWKGHTWAFVSLAQNLSCKVTFCH